MRHTGLFLIACLTAALAPCWQEGESYRIGDESFPGWPENLSGAPLRELPLTSREQAFARCFPGYIGRFTDGKMEYVIRWVTTKTRKLHPAADCMLGSGYQIRPLPLKVDEDGATWGAFEARRGEATLLVHEKIVSANGASWTDVSSWYWSLPSVENSGPWWAITRISAVVSEESPPNNPVPTGSQPPGY